MIRPRSGTSVLLLDSRYYIVMCPLTLEHLDCVRVSLTCSYIASIAMINSRELRPDVCQLLSRMSLCYLCCSSSISLNLGPHYIDFTSQTILSVTSFVVTLQQTTYNYHNTWVLGQNIPGENVFG